jgi:hypothetical protein
MNERLSSFPYFRLVETVRPIQNAHRALPPCRTSRDQTHTAEGFAWSRVKAA